MRETFVQLDRNRISIRLPKQPGADPNPLSSSIACSASSTPSCSRLSWLSICVPPKRVTTQRAQGTIYLTGGQMFQGADDLLAYVKDEGVEFIDIRFCDLPGIMQHFTVPVGTFGPEYFEDGVNFDGSSIRGFQKIHESDMALLPDPATAFVDPSGA